MEKIEQKDSDRVNTLHDVASILARRVAVEISDSDSGSDDSEYDSEGWAEQETTVHWRRQVLILFLAVKIAQNEQPVLYDPVIRFYRFLYYFNFAPVRYNIVLFILLLRSLILVFLLSSPSYGFLYRRVSKLAFLIFYTDILVF